MLSSDFIIDEQMALIKKNQTNTNNGNNGNGSNNNNGNSGKGGNTNNSNRSNNNSGRGNDGTNNNSNGKENSAPYWIGALAGHYYDNEMIEEVEIEAIAVMEIGCSTKNNFDAKVRVILFLS